MMSEVLYGQPSFRVCAFCRYWYNLSNEGIEPGNAPRRWKYDRSMESKCLKRNIQTGANRTCSNFTPKF